MGSVAQMGEQWTSNPKGVSPNPTRIFSVIKNYRTWSVECVSIKEKNSVNCDRPGECSPEKDCLR